MGSEGLRGVTHVAVTATAVTVASGLTLAAEVWWAAHRRLPRCDEVDATGLVGTASEAAPLRVVVLGDSTLTGPGLTSAEDVWVRRALAAMDLGRPIEVVSFAVGGSRVADVRARLDEAFAVPADAAVLSVGGNDAIHGTSAGAFRRQYHELLGEILERVPVAAVANVGDLGNIARFPAPLRSVVRARGRTFCRTIERVAARHDRAVLMDVTPSNRFFRDRSLFAADMFHPNRDGHGHWADAARPGLLLALSRLDPTRVDLTRIDLTSADLTRVDLDQKSGANLAV